MDWNRRGAPFRKTCREMRGFSPRGRLCQQKLQKMKSLHGASTGSRLAQCEGSRQGSYIAFRACRVGIALQGLAEGGASAVAKPPTVRFYGEPVQVEAYARTGSNGLRSWKT